MYRTEVNSSTLDSPLQVLLFANDATCTCHVHVSCMHAHIREKPYKLHDVIHDMPRPYYAKTNTDHLASPPGLPRRREAATHHNWMKLEITIVRCLSPNSAAY